MIKLIRLSDNREFTIDSENSLWKATKIEGIDALTLNVYTETPAIGVGEIVTGKHTGRRDINITAHRSSHKFISDARDTIINFFNPDDTYKMEIEYNGKNLCIDGELLAYKLPTENIHRPLDLTFTMLCPDPYFYKNKSMAISPYARFMVGGIYPVAPIFTFNLYHTTKITVYIDNESTIEIVLPVKYFTISNITWYELELDCKEGILTNKTTKEDLTEYIKKGSTFIFHNEAAYHVVRYEYSSQTQDTSGTLQIPKAPATYVYSPTMEWKIQSLTITYPDSQTETYTTIGHFSHKTSSGDLWAIDIYDYSFKINGSPNSTFQYRAKLEDPVAGSCSANILIKEQYRGF